MTEDKTGLAAIHPIAFEILIAVRVKGSAMRAGHGRILDNCNRRIGGAQDALIGPNLLRASRACEPRLKSARRAQEEAKPSSIYQYVPSVHLSPTRSSVC